MWKTSQKHQTRIGDPLAFVELDSFKRRHSAENFQATVGNLGQPCVVGLQSRQPRDVLGGSVSRIAAVHAAQLLEVPALSHMPEARISDADRSQLPQRRKSREQ